MLTINLKESLKEDRLEAMFFIGDSLLLDTRRDTRRNYKCYGSQAQNLYAIQNFQIKKVHKSYNNIFFYRFDNKIIIYDFGGKIYKIADENKLQSPIKELNEIKKSLFFQQIINSNSAKSTSKIIFSLRHFTTFFRNSVANDYMSLCFIPNRLLLQLENVVDEKENLCNVCLMNFDSSGFKIFKFESTVKFVAISESELIAAIYTDNHLLHFIDLDE